MVKFIPAELTLALRSKILRNGQPEEKCIFPTDNLPGAFHLAVYVENQMATVASFFPQRYADREEPGYQLRGMATDVAFKGKGYGSQLIKFAVDYIKQSDAQYLWCNARTSAVDFYRKLGFKIQSEEFDIPGVGLHYEMILNLY